MHSSLKNTSYIYQFFITSHAIRSRELDKPSTAVWLRHNAFYFILCGHCSLSLIRMIMPFSVFFPLTYSNRILSSFLLTKGFYWIKIISFSWYNIPLFLIIACSSPLSLSDHTVSSVKLLQLLLYEYYYYYNY